MLNGLFINSSSVTGGPIRLNNNQYLRSRNFLNTADINILRVNSLDQIEFSSIPYVNSLGRVALLSDVTDYSGQIAALQLAVGNLETDVNTIEGQVSTLQGQVVVVQLDISSIENSINFLQSDVHILETTVSGIQSDIVEIEASVLALQLLQGTYLLLNGTRPMTGALNMATHKISNVVDPTLPQDAATKAYVDANIVDISGLELRVDALEISVGGLETDVSNLQLSVSFMQAEIDGIQSDIDYIYTVLGESNTASNVGAGAGLFKQKVGTDLQFKSIVAGTNITITSSADTITINSIGAGDISSASNIGAGEGVFSSKVLSDLQFKTLVAGSNISLVAGVDSITINASGSSSPVAISKDGVVISSSVSDINFTGTNINVTDMGAGVVDVSVSSSGGEVNTASNVGAGSGVFKQKTGVDLEFKSLIAGANVTITPGVDTITISSVGGGGGGSGIIYYFNGGLIEISDIPPYYQMSKFADVGAGADFIANVGSTQMIARFITVVGEPYTSSIPGGNWNFEMFFSSSSAGGSPSFYLELYKYDVLGASTLIASNSIVPEVISGGTSIDLYLAALAVPTTVIDPSDRLVVEVYVNRDGRDITLHTQNGHVCQVTTTLAVTSITQLNNLSVPVQYLSVGSSGSDFNIVSDIDNHTFNIPDASPSNARGLLTSGDWIAFDSKEANTASNVGGGAGVFKQKSGADLEFKTLIAGANVTITDDVDTITIEAGAGTSVSYNKAVWLSTPGATFNLGTTPLNRSVMIWLYGAGGVSGILRERLSISDPVGNWDFRTSGTNVIFNTSSSFWSSGNTYYFYWAY